MKKKPVINGSILIFVIGAVAGLYFYTKRSIKKIVAAMDDTFDIEDNNNIIQCQFDLTKTNKNGSSCAKNAFIPKEEEEENQKKTIKIHNFKFDNYYKHIEPISIQEEIEKAIQEKCEECSCKKNEEHKIYNPTWQYQVDDQFYQDYINTINAFRDEDDEK